jgi:hypothetical protein
MTDLFDIHDGPFDIHDGPFDIHFPANLRSIKISPSPNVFKCSSNVTTNVLTYARKLKKLLILLVFEN